MLDFCGTRCDARGSQCPKASEIMLVESQSSRQVKGDMNQPSPAQPAARLAVARGPQGGRPTLPVLPALLLLFVGSGCAALIFEIVWLQMLQLVLGLTAVSLGLLLGSFMGGLCLGSLLFARCVPASRHPLRVYACLELGIGAIGVAVLFAVPELAQWYTGKGAAGTAGTVLRGTLAAVCLLPPTVLMGATLPALARAVHATREGVSWLGFFYSANIAGAVAGCLLAGFYLLRLYDMGTATYAAASLNALLAVGAWGLALITPCSGFASEPRPQNENGQSVAGAWVVYVAIGLSGLTALGAEVVWTRLLSLCFGGTVYTFSLILAVVLAGLGLGASLGGVISRLSLRPATAFAWCQGLLVGAIGWAAVMIAQSVPYWPVNPMLSLSPWYTFQLDLARCLWVVLPAAILWGASFPLAIASLARVGADPARLVGSVYAANTVGAIAGALGFTLVVVPAIGSTGAEQALVFFVGVSALLLLARPTSSAGEPEQPSGSTVRNRSRRGIAIVSVAAITAGLLWSMPAVPWGLIAYGRFVPSYGKKLIPGIINESRVPSGAAASDIYCTYVGEGLNGSVAVTKNGAGVRSFHSAGKVQASTEPQDMRLQLILGHLSALVHQKPESVLVVACGAGVTAGTFVTHPELKRLMVCDIERLVPQFVAPLFERENQAVLKDPRTQVVIDDGRHFLRTTQEQFDIITSDPIDPWVKGCAALNTLDYYEMCKAHLKPGGVMSLWVPLYESNPEAIKSMIATFFKAFPNAVLWSNDRDGEAYDAVLLGQLGPLQLDLDQLQLRLNRPDHVQVKRSLAKIEIYTAVDLLSTYAGQAPDLQGWAQGAQINTDRNLRLQYLAGWGFNSYIGSELLADVHHYYRFPEKLFVGSQARLQILRFALEGEPK